MLNHVDPAFSQCLLCARHCFRRFKKKRAINKTKSQILVYILVGDSKQKEINECETESHVMNTNKKNEAGDREASKT